MIQLKEIEIYNIGIEAESEEEAMDIAMEKFEALGERGKMEYHDDSDGSVQCIDN